MPGYNPTSEQLIKTLIVDTYLLEECMHQLIATTIEQKIPQSLSCFLSSYLTNIALQLEQLDALKLITAAEKGASKFYNYDTCADKKTTESITITLLQLSHYKTANYAVINIYYYLLGQYELAGFFDRICLGEYEMQALLTETLASIISPEQKQYG